MNIYFLEVHRNNFSRYVNEIADRLLQKPIQPRIFYIIEPWVDTDFERPGGEYGSVELVPVKELGSHLGRHPPDAFVCCGYRIPDVYWTRQFKKLGARTFQVQHGLYTEHLGRSLRRYFSNFGRKLRYLRYFLRLLFSPMTARLRTIVSLMRRDFLPFDFDAHICPSLASDEIFVWGDYWRDWFTSHLFYDRELVTFTTCGSFDHFLLQTPSALARQDNAVAYICQTLVEDGRIKRRVFTEFVGRLTRFARNFDGHLIVKPHPRTDLSLYAGLTELSNVRVEHRLPICARYIGHYSGLLCVCFRADSSVLLVDFPGHDIPEYFRTLACRVIDWMQEIEVGHFEAEVARKEIDPSHYYLPVEDPYAVIAERIAEHHLISGQQT